MPSDAKLGLVVGVGLVIAIAAVFFRKAEPPANARIVGEIRSDARAPLPIPAPPRPASTKSGTLVNNTRRHTVSDGDTLFSLAQQYYRDERRFVDIYQANRDTLETPTRLTPGSVLVIPD